MKKIIIFFLCAGFLLASANTRAQAAINNPPEEWIKDELNISAELAKSYLTEGIRYYQSEQYHLAVLILRKSIAAFPLSPAHLYLGHSLVELGDYSEAEIAYKNGLDISEKYGSGDKKMKALFLFGLFEIYTQKENWPELKNTCERLLPLVDDDYTINNVNIKEQLKKLIATF